MWQSRLYRSGRGVVMFVSGSYIKSASFILRVCLHVSSGRFEQRYYLRKVRNTRRECHDSMLYIHCCGPDGRASCMVPLAIVPSSFNSTQIQLSRL